MTTKKARKDLSGMVFGRLTVLRQYGFNGFKITWLCKCSCGNTHVASGNMLMRGSCKSCGCLKREKLPIIGLKHGFARRTGKHPAYRAWISMKLRCYGNGAKWKRTYQKRGITICDEWINSPDAFLKDMEPSWKRGLSLHRIDNNKGYSKENCKWATAKEQSRETTRSRKITIDGITMVASDWCSHLGLPVVTFYSRIKRGMSDIDALLAPRVHIP